MGNNDESTPQPSGAQIRLSVFHELAQQGLRGDDLVAETLRLSHVIEHGTEPAKPTE